MFKLLFSSVLVFVIIVENKADKRISNRSRDGNDLYRNVFSVLCATQTDCEFLINATCLEGYCLCNGTKLCHSKDDFLPLVNIIGLECKQDDHCNVEHSVCVGDGDNKVCVCRDGLIASTDSRKCLNVSHGIGSGCEDNVQCYTKTPSSVCQNGTCVCDSHTHNSNGTCSRNVQLHGSCNSNAECAGTAQAQCVNSKCTCTNGYVSNSAATECLPIANALGAPCYENAQCTDIFGGATECSEGFCACKELYQLKKSIQKCVRDMKLGEKCMEHSDCHGPEPGARRLECILGECKCRSQYIEENGYCTNSSAQHFITNWFIQTMSILTVLCLLF